MDRESLSLDGTWQIAFDPGNEGRRRGWAQWEQFRADAPCEPIEVPACWERFRQDYEGVGWYGRTFTVPGDWHGRSVRIHFGAANYRSEVWVNDTVIGHHEGGYTDFAFEIGDVLRFGDENTVVVRVIGPIVTQDIEIDGIGRNDVPHWRGAIAGGLWQPVRLVASDPVHVSDLFAHPNRSLTGVCVRLAVENTTLSNRDLRIRLSVVPLGVVRDGDKPGGSIADDFFGATVAPGETVIEQEMLLARPELWSPESPSLYRMEAELSDGDDPVDADSVRFGMRRLVIEDDDYLLNGQPRLVKSTFFEGLYPTTLAAPPDEAFVRHELQLAKDAGFNLIRPWRKPQPPVVYDVADEMGLMFIGGMPIECMRRWPTATPYLEERLKNEVRESVRRDRNHACIVMWEIFNELGREELRRIKHRVSREAGRLDPSRVVLDESGGWAGGASVYPPGSTVPRRINDVHGYLGAPLDQRGYDSYLALAKTEGQMREMGIEPFTGNNSAAHLLPGVFTHISEMGYGSLPDLEANCEQYRREGNPLTPEYRYHHELLDHFTRALEFTGLNELFPTVRDFCLATQETHAAANKLMVEAARLNPDVDGFGIHAYTDGDWIVGAGLLDIFRNPKKPYYAAVETNQPVYLALRTSERNVYGPREVMLAATVASELPEGFDGRLEAQVVDGEGSVVAQHECTVCIQRGVTALLREPLPTAGLSGLLALRGKLYDGDRLVTENAYEFRVVPADSIPVPETDIVVADPSGALQDYLKSRATAFAAFGPDAGDQVVLANAAALWRQDADGLGPALVEFTRSGGTVVYLDLPMGRQPGHWFQEGIVAAPWLPVQLQMQRTRGLWTPFAHIIREHPIARGLAAGKAMDYDCVSVFPHFSIVHVAEGDPMVVRQGIDLWTWLGDDARRAPACTLGLGYNRGAQLEDLDYRGPGPVVFGADVLDLPCGEGRIVLSTLRLVGSLGRDPVADILLANIVDWAAGLGQS